MKTLLLSIIALCFSTFGFSQTELWGMTADGGEFSSGVIFKTDIDGTNQSVEHDFFTNVGITTIYVKLCEASNGKFYGTARMDGSGSAGVLFEYDPVTEVYTKKIDFLGAANGKNPEGGLFEASNGLLYGMTSRGGAHDVGVLYSYDPATNTLINLFDFDGNTGGQNGSLPYGTLVEAPNGRLYGLTSRGGSNNAGVLFEYNPATSVFVKKVTFIGVNGSRPYGTLMEASDGKFYATTYQGGTSSLGTIFSYTAGATFVTKEIDFNGTVRGSYPIGNLEEAPNGRLYGTASAGGTNGDGTLFEFRLSNGNFVKKVDFNSAVTGDTPSGSVIYASNGLFYGMTRTGGANDDGVLYSYDYVSNTFTHRFDFDAGPTGDRPSGALLESGGLFYGLTYTGGSMGGGALFEFDPATDIYTKKVDLAASPFGSNPYGSLMQHSNNKLYGLSRIGGAANDGVIFEYDHATGTYTRLYEFGLGLDGRNPRGELMEATNGKLYGLTDRGGVNGVGTLFEYDVATSTFVNLIDFDGTNGAYPKGSLLEASNGKLYGMTREGGVNDEGVLFEYVIATNTLTLKVEFDLFVSGRWPSGSLIEASNGLLYGLTENGGTNYRGVIFDFDTSTDTYTKQYDFDTEHQPFGQLVEATNGNLYGLTLTGGANSGGALFEYAIATSTYTNKYDFDGFPYTNGANSYGSLIEASNGHLYGMTKGGGIYGEGVIFEWNLATDTYTMKTEFDYTNGANPEYGRLLEVSIPCTPTTSTDVQSACDTYTWIDGGVYTMSNNSAQWIVPNAAGCDSIITLDLTINNSNTGTDVQTACNTFTWVNGSTYTSSITGPTWTETNVAGCDSVVTLDLTINYSNTGTDVQTACNTFTWVNGSTYTSSITGPTWTETNVAGCDSVVTLDLTINYSNTGTDVQTACTTFTWVNGSTYTSSITGPTWTETNVAGCDSVVTLDLTINYSNTGTDVQTACNSFTWVNGSTYTSSITGPTWTETNVAGCDSVVTLDLTINYANTGTDVQTACNTFTWVNGSTYSSSITGPTWTEINVAGCDSVVTLDLTINYSNTGTDVQTACNTFTWVNGSTYTSSITGPTWTETNVAGCDSVVTLDLTINYSSASTDAITACGSSGFEIAGNFIDDNWDGATDEYLGYQWIDNNYYTNSNNAATVTLTNAALCDSVVTLDLIVLPAYSTSFDVISACDSYTWINGVTYTSSVIPTGVADIAEYYTDVNGCDSLRLVLDLTINSSTSSTDVQTTCNTFTWIDGNTYTSSNNTATYTEMNAAGCDSIVTLDLTMSYSSASTDVQTACDFYTWIDGNTYTSSNNTATHTELNAAGCDSIITLDLTITPLPNNSVTQAGAMLTSDASGATYQWLDCDDNDNAIAGETNQSFTPMLTGNYAVEVTMNGCTDTSACYLVDYTGLDEVDAQSILIYPNPTNGIFNIKVDANIAAIEVVDMLGRKVLLPINLSEAKVDATNLVTGKYMVRIITDNDKVLIKEFVVQN